ncbi:MAG: aminotransferase class I/II-fold pyridoxal phosphate-dependent enzyme [Saprospiraceae bacterium]|nr:aminotransferase class I/II-fold pyridoxal phosphate-dependent enzyme [Saprospiraceae bacterium]
MTNIPDKLPNTETSIFAKMTALALQHDAINLAQGFPNFDVDPILQMLVYDAMQNGFNQYSPMPGNLSLRTEIANKISKLYQIDIDPETQITVTAGATQALFTAFTAFLHKGDEVILFEPAYDSYIPSILANEAVPVPICTKAPDFAIDWNEVRSKISKRTKMLIINTPSNPSGKIIDRSDWDEIADIAEEHNLLVISDEVYEHLIFDNNIHHPAFTIPGLENRFISVFSFGKTFHATGWKIGYIVASKKLNDIFKKIHQFNVFSVHTPSQVALADYIVNDKNYKNLSSFYQSKRDFMLSAFAQSKLKPLECKGTYFLCYDYSDISDLDEVAFAEWLTRTHKVASIPISSFYHNNFNQKIIRFCFAKTEDTILKAAENLLNL